MNAEKPWFVIGRGFAGWHAKGINVSSSGGNLLPYKYGDTPCAGYLAEAREGALVYDAEACESDPAARSAFVQLVISGPLVDPRLPPGSYQKLGADLREAALRLPGLEEGFRTIASLATDERFGGLDSVGVDIYEALLRKVPGIKIGRVVDGAVKWEGA